MKKYVLFAILLCACGCASAPVQRAPVVTDRTYNAPFDKVWTATVAAISGQYPVKVVEKASGLITTDFVSGSVKGYGYAPSVMLAIWADGKHTVTALVSKIDDTHTSVKLTVHLECYEMNVSKAWHIWDSNGSLESILLQSIGANL